MSDSNERSSLWGLGATAALGGGVGYGMYQNRTALLTALKTGNVDVAEKTASLMSEVGSFNMRQVPSSVMSATGEGIVSQLNPSYANQVREDIAAGLYESILAGGQTPHAAAQGAFNSVLNQPDAISAYKQAAIEMGRFGGDASVLNARLEGFTNNYAMNRIGKLTDVIASEGIDAVRPNEGLAAMGIYRGEAESVASRLSFAADQAGVKFEVTGYYNVAGQLEDKAVTTPMMSLKIGNTSANIPLADTGLTYGGEHLTSRYRLRGSHGVEGSMGYGKRYTSVLEDALLGKRSQTEANRALHKANLDVIETLNLRDSEARAQAVWNLPEEVMPSGARAKSRLVGLQSVSQTQKAPNIEDIIKQTFAPGSNQKLYPIGSPDTVAKGTMYTTDIAEDLYGPGGRMFPVERRPDQFVRGDWGVTAEAKANATGFKGSFGESFSRFDRKVFKGSEWEKLMYGGAEATSAKAYSAPQLATFYAKSGDLGFENQALNEMMFAEEAMINKSVVGMMEHEKVVPKKITLAEGFKVNKQAYEAIRGKGVGELQMFDAPIGGSRFLGIEQGTGKELWASKEAAMTSEVIGAELSGGNTATLYMRERHRLADGEWWKGFSEEMKFMGQARSNKEIMEAVNTAGVKAFTGQQIEALYSSKLLERNPMARWAQQMEAMSMFAGQKVDTKQLSLRRRLLAQEFLANPEESLGVRNLLNAGTKDAEYQIEKNMVSLAKRFKFNQDEMGLTFGLMNTEVAEKLGIGTAVQESPGVFGLSKMRLGSPATMNVGSLATMEHSGFRLLAMKGEEGPALVADLASRLLDKGESDPANRMLDSLTNNRNLLNREKATMNLADVAGDIVGPKGKSFNLGRKVEAFGGASVIDVAGFEEAPSLMRNRISGSSGKVIPSPITKELNILRSSLRRGSEEEIEAAARGLRDVVHQAAELQGAAKGKILGSRFLTGLGHSAKAYADDSFEISRDTAKDMFEEMINAESMTIKQREFLKGQHKALAEGETLIGGIWRHPTSGPESFQAAKYRINPKLKGKAIVAPKSFGEITIGGTTRKVDVSHMLGFKGDFDKDTFAIAALSDRDTVARLSKRIDTDIRSQYTEYAFRHYALEEAMKGGTAEKAISQMSRKEALSIGARKLTEAKLATGQVNVALQKLKVGLQYAAPKEYRPLADIFWHLEEAAISGKHRVLERSLFSGISEVAKTNNVELMENLLTGVFGEKRLVKGELKAGAASAAKSFEVNPAKWARDIVGSMSAVSDDVDLVYKSSAVASGKMTIDEVNKIAAMAYQRRSGSIDVAQSIMNAERKGLSGISQKGTRILRKGAAKTASVMNVLKRAKGPALIGAGVAAVMLAAAPSVSGSVGSATLSSGGGKNLSPDSSGPPGGDGITPPPARMWNSPKTYDMSSARMSSRANINMSLGDANASSRDFMRHARDLSNGGNVRIRTIDDRSILDSQSLANKIHERL